MSFLRLFERFILRALLREKTRSVVAALGIALGIAVMIAVRLANSSVTDTFKAAVDSVSGNASLRIRGTAGRFDELLLAELDWMSAYGQLSPVIEAYAMVADDVAEPSAGNRFPRGEMLCVLGVDVLLDFPLRDYHVLKLGADDEKYAAREALRLLDDPHSVILTEKYLRRHGVRVGEQIPLVFGSRQESFKIRGVLLDRGPAQTLDGNFALMDIAAAQLAADRLGVIDYVDVLLRDGIVADKVLPEIQQRMPAGLVAEFPDATSARADTMVAAFQFNLAALSAVSLIVGLFLIYNTIATSVAARRSEIGVFQAVGAGRRTVLLLFLAEAMLLAVVGVSVGLPAGRMLATAAVTGTAQTVETFYIASLAVSSAGALQLSGRDIALAVGIGVPLALLAAAMPAWEGATVQPVDAVRGMGTRMSAIKLRKVMGAAFMCLGLGWGLTLGKPIAGRPVLGFVAELLFMLGGALLTPAILWAICRLCRRALARVMPVGRVELQLAAANLSGALPRVSVSVAALAISLSMMVAIAVMVGSFRETVVYWLDSALSADLSVKPVMQTSAVSEARLSQSAVETIQSDPDVADTIWYTSRQIPFRQRNIRLIVTELDKTIEHVRLLFKTPPPNQGMLPASETESVFVSESFAMLFGTRAGRWIELPTAGGIAKLHVAGVYYDYASNQGTVMMDVDTYRRHYGDSDPYPAPQHLSVYLHPQADVERVRDRLLREIGESEQIYCVTNHEVRVEAMRIFESTFTVTYALQMIAIVVAGLGVATTLITLIYQRQREIGLLSLVGATAKQIRRVIVFEAVILGGASQLIGIGVGILLALVLIYVINVQSFGWTIQFFLPFRFLLQSTLLVIGASGLFGLYPAVRAASVDALQTVREE